MQLSTTTYTDIDIITGMIKKLTHEQIQFINEIDANIYLSAGPGAGKTTTMIQKIKRLLNLFPKDKILYLSFNKKLSHEFATKLDHPRVISVTFHSLIYKIYQNTFKQVPIVITDQTKIQENIHFVTFQYLEEWLLKNFTDLTNYLIKQSIRYIFIDEVQDLNNNLLEIVTMLKNLKLVKINVVGDIDQMIYGFAGVQLQKQMQFQKQFSKHMTLTQTFRLGKRTTQLLNSEFQTNLRSFSNKPDNLTSIILDSDSNQKQTIRLLLSKWLKQSANIQEMGLTKQERLFPLSISQDNEIIAILVRTNYLADQLFYYLKKHNLPIFKLGEFSLQEKAFFKKLKTITNQLILSYGQNNINNINLQRIADELRESLEGTRIPKEFLTNLIKQEDLSKDDSINTLISKLSILEFETANYLTNLPNSGAINISTIHQSKGLEFDSVLLPFFEIPPFNFKNPDEKNIAFVALSRHKNSLFIIHNSNKEPVLKRSSLSTFFEVYKNPTLTPPKQGTLF